MKDYLESFLSRSRSGQRVRKSPSNTPTKPSKCHSVGFVGGATRTANSPICCSSLSIEAGRQYVHIWCAQGCHDSWIALDGMKLSDTDAPGFGRGRAMVSAAIARGACPDCDIPLNPQDREQSILVCGECGVRIVKGEKEWVQI